MTTGADVVREARARIGVRWQHQAAVDGVAYDCLGLVGCVGIALALPDAIAWSRDAAVKSYGRVPDARALMAGCRRYLDPVPLSEIAIGHILVFRFDREPQHFAIVSSLDPLYIVHSYAAARRVCETGASGEWRAGITWKSLIVAAFCFRGLD